LKAIDESDSFLDFCNIRGRYGYWIPGAAR